MTTDLKQTKKTKAWSSQKAVYTASDMAFAVLTATKALWQLVINKNASAERPFPEHVPIDRDYTL